MNGGDVHMKPGVTGFCMAIAIQAMSSWSLDSVTVGNREWLQPNDFADKGYTYNQISEVCPRRICSGLLGGSVDLTGYVWASSDEVEQLFAAYTKAGRFILSDFEPMERDTDIGDILLAFLGDAPEKNNVILLVFINGDGATGENKEISKSSPGLNVPLNGGPWFWRPLENPNIQIKLEEPIDGQAHSGIGNLRGWAIAEDGIDRVEIYIDGKYVYNAPYGGSRGDVKRAYPDIPVSGHSGFSLAFGYSNLGFGQHTIMARAFNQSGEWADASSTFDVAVFDKNFIEEGDVVDASDAQTTASGDEIFIENILIGDQLYDLRLKWRTQEQGFEIVEIR